MCVCAGWPSSGHKLLHLQIFFPPFGRELLLLRLIVPGIKDAEGMSAMKSSLCEKRRNALRDRSIYWATTPRNVMKHNLKSGRESERGARKHTHAHTGWCTHANRKPHSDKKMTRQDRRSTAIQPDLWRKITTVSGPELPHPSELSPSRKSPSSDYWTLIAFTLLEQDLGGECRCRSFCRLHKMAVAKTCKRNSVKDVITHLIG